MGTGRDKWTGIVRPDVSRVPKIKTPCSIRFDEERKEYLITHPWGQELPAFDSEVEFWQLSEDTRKLCREPYLSEWIAKVIGYEVGTTGFEGVVRAFSAHVIDTADEARKIREKKRLDVIREVRTECGLDPETGLDLPEKE